MYAIVKTGGKQYKVAVGDVVQVEKVSGGVGDAVALPALLLVDGDKVTTDTTALAGVSVSGEVVAHTKGPKLNILHYKNKTGYRRRMGHRQSLTQVRVTGIDTKGTDTKGTDTKGTGTKGTAAKSTATKSTAAKSTAAKSTAATTDTTSDTTNDTGKA